MPSGYFLAGTGVRSVGEHLDDALTQDAVDNYVAVEVGAQVTAAIVNMLLTDAQGSDPGLVARHQRREALIDLATRLGLADAVEIILNDPEQPEGGRDKIVTFGEYDDEALHAALTASVVAAIDNGGENIEGEHNGHRYVAITGGQTLRDILGPTPLDPALRQ